MIAKSVVIRSLISVKKKISGSMIPPPDKSITHRAIFLASLSKKKSVIRNPLISGDCLSTLKCIKQLGVPFKITGNKITVFPDSSENRSPFRKLKPPLSPLNCENSGTTMRMISGILAAQPFISRLTGDSSLSHRPMKRVIEPLRRMGADIRARGNNYAPIQINGNNRLKPIFWKSPVASAQVKSALLFAGMFAKGTTTVQEPYCSRDHTERMLKSLGTGVRIFPSGTQRSGHSVSIRGQIQLRGIHATVPGDFSGASFFIAAALIVPGSKLNVRGVNLNPTRKGLMKVLKRMGAKIQVKNFRTVSCEPVGDLIVESSALRGASVRKDEIPFLIDEIPILAVIATQSAGRTVIQGAEELRVKESDRLSAIASQLEKMGAKIKEIKDGLMIDGPVSLQGAAVNSFKDHRIAMSLAVAALIARGHTTIQNFDCVRISFPNFLSELRKCIR